MPLIVHPDLSAPFLGIQTVQLEQAKAETVAEMWALVAQPDNWILSVAVAIWEMCCPLATSL